MKLNENNIKQLEKFLVNHFDYMDRIQSIKYELCSMISSNAVYKLEVCYHNAHAISSTQFIIKFYLPKKLSTPSAKKRNEISAKREFDILEKLLENGLSVPRGLKLIYEDSPMNYPFIITEFINTRQFSYLLNEKLVDDRELDEVLKSSVDFLYNIHKINFHIFDYLEARESYIDIKYLSYKVQKYRLRGFRKILKWIQKRGKNVFSKENMCFIHGDVHAGNLLVNSENRVSIIDWEDSKISDYRFDIAKLIISTSLQYCDRVVEIYEKISNKKISDIHYFIVIISLTKVIKFYILLKTINTQGKHSQKMDVIRKNISNVFYRIDIISKITDVSLVKLRYEITNELLYFNN